jgi:orotidine-5'-phosphate decarboxylase
MIDGFKISAREKLLNSTENGRHICVGLDSDLKKIPAHLLTRPNPVLEFNKIIIESTFESAAAYKLNFAFYEHEGSKGFDILRQTLELIPGGILTIADAKRGDIGNSSRMYARSVFDSLNFDSVTLHPYMGFDSLEPFIAYKTKINFILALTSNKGALDFEKQKLAGGRFLYQGVIEKVKEWNINSNCGIVFGATNTEELESNIDSFGDLAVLLPGVGAQGGSLEDVARTFCSRKKKNYLVNVSRGLIYVDNSPGYAGKVTKTMKDLNSIITSFES